MPEHEIPTHEQLARLEPLLALSEEEIKTLADIAVGINTASRVKRLGYALFAALGVLTTAVIGTWAVLDHFGGRHQ